MGRGALFMKQEFSFYCKVMYFHLTSFLVDHKLLENNFLWFWLWCLHVSFMCRVKLVGRDYSPLGHNLVDPDKSGMATQYDLGNTWREHGTNICVVLCE